MWDKVPYRLHGDPRLGCGERRDAVMLDCGGLCAQPGDAVIETFVRSTAGRRESREQARGGSSVGAFTGTNGYPAVSPGAGSYLPDRTSATSILRSERLPAAHYRLPGKKTRPGHSRDLGIAATCCRRQSRSASRSLRAAHVVAPRRPRAARRDGWRLPLRTGLTPVLRCAGSKELAEMDRDAAQMSGCRAASREERGSPPPRWRLLRSA